MSSPYLIIHNQLRLNGADMDIKNLLLLSDAMKYTGLSETDLKRKAAHSGAMCTLPHTKATVFFKDKLSPYAPSRITRSTAIY